MGKKKAALIKKILRIIFIIIFLIVLSVQLWLLLTGSDRSLSSLIYWLILAGWIYLIVVLRHNSGVAFKIAFSLFIVGAILNILSITNVSETFMRVSFIGWIIGIGQALIEYKRISKE